MPSETTEPLEPHRAYALTVQALVQAALDGASDTGLVATLADKLSSAGLDLSSIEVACDVVDPEHGDHVFCWHRGSAAIGREIAATGVFQTMLAGALPILRIAAQDRFASVLPTGATDAVAFAGHLAADVTIGFFDDVMILFVTDRPGGFPQADLELLQSVTPVFALALGARLNAAAARMLLRTYLGQDAATAMLDGRVGLGEVEQIRAVVLYCDLASFTPLTETLDPRTLIDSLNLFFDVITRPAAGAGGQVSGHVGDAVVLFFPVPDAASEQSVCAAAVSAAREGLKALELLTIPNSAGASARLRARIGIDMGSVVHGNIGSPGRFSFTIIGTPVNRAARLQALAKELGATLLMRSDLAEAAGVHCSGFGTHVLRGFDEPVEVVGFGVPEI